MTSISRNIAVVMLLFVAIAQGTSAENQVQVELIADVEAAASGESFRAGVIFRMPERAHIYWRNPGDSGLPTGVEWAPSESMEVGALQWPNPQQFTIEGLDDVNYGYEGETLLFSTVTATGEGDSITLRAEAVWLLCLDDGECIPEQAELALEIPLAAESTPSENAALFDRHAARVPQSLSNFADQFQTATIKPYFWINFRPPLQAIPSFDGQEMAFFPESGPHWSRVLPGPEYGSPRATFERVGPDDEKAGGMRALPKGVLTVPIGDPRTNEVNVEYILFDE